MAQETAIDFLLEKMSNLGVVYAEGKVLKELNDSIKKAKAMEKEQIILAINNVSEKNVKYANMIVASWSQIEGELFMHNTKLAEQYYNETYNK